MIVKFNDSVTPEKLNSLLLEFLIDMKGCGISDERLYYINAFSVGFNTTFRLEAVPIPRNGFPTLLVTVRSVQDTRYLTMSHFTNLPARFLSANSLVTLQTQFERMNKSCSRLITISSCDSTQTFKSPGNFEHDIPDRRDPRVSIKRLDVLGKPYPIEHA